MKISFFFPFTECVTGTSLFHVYAPKCDYFYRLINSYVPDCHFGTPKVPILSFVWNWQVKTMKNVTNSICHEKQGNSVSHFSVAPD